MWPEICNKNGLFPGEWEYGGKNMKNETGFTKANQQYKAAHAAHYTRKDLHEALKLYISVMAAHPNTQEAEYSRSQVKNIVNSVVSKEKIFSAQVSLALNHFDGEDRPDMNL